MLNICVFDVARDIICVHNNIILSGEQEKKEEEAAL